MKKLLLLTLTTTLGLSTLAFANEINTEDNTKTSQAVAPTIAIDFDTFEEIVPLRTTAEELGYEVIWNKDSQNITIVNDINTLIATPNSNIYTINGERITLETKTSIINGVTFVPISFINYMENNNNITTLPSDINEDVQSIITETIENKIDELTKEQLIANEEYREAFLATGGTKEDYKEPSFEIGYNILSLSDNYTSILVYRHQSLASSFTEEIYYTFDLSTGEIVTLEDLLGEGYEERVKEEVIETALIREENDEVIYSHELLDDIIIDETTSFYINEDGNIIVVFPKYSLTSGSYGTQEFLIGVDQKNLRQKGKM